MKRSELRLVVGAVLAVAVPAVVLHFSTPDERLAAGLTAAPFAWPHVLVAHLVTAVPLGILVAGWLRAVPAVKDTAAGLWVVVGFASAGVVTVLSPGIGESIVASEFGAVPLLLLRTIIAFVLVLPWCVAALETQAAVSRPGVAFGVGLALAVVPCGMYADALCAARTKQAAELLSRERLVKAASVVSGLCELGSEQPIMNQSPADVRKGLERVIKKLQQAAERSFPALAAPHTRIGRAVLMVQLNRADEAVELLQPLVPDHREATLLLAAVHQEQERWDDSDALFSATLERLLPAAGTDAPARAHCLTAFEGLVFNARTDRRPADAERVLKRGLDALPSEAAYFHFHLGQHYADGGRPALAIEHLSTAAAIDPDKYRVPTDDRIRRIQMHTPGCFLTAPR